MSASVSGSSSPGQDAVLVAVALQDRLHDQLGRIAGHGAFQAAQGGLDDPVDLVVAPEQRSDAMPGRPRRQQTDFEEDGPPWPGK